MLWFIAAALAFALPIRAESSRVRPAPSYSAASIVNAASNIAGPLAPYTLASVYGAGLAHSTRAVLESDVRDKRLPTVLDGVRIWIDSLPAPLYFVSPTQVNFLVPYISGPGQVSLTVSVDSVSGAPARVELRQAAPAFFLQRDGQTIVATHSDWSPVTQESPACPGEDVVLFATGLGRFIPAPAAYLEFPAAAARIERWEDLRLELGGAELERSRISYAGVTPGFAGLYQINLTLPEQVSKDPEVRVLVAGEASPPGFRLPFGPCKTEN